MKVGMGVDVSRFGSDRSVCALVQYHPGQRPEYRLTTIQDWGQLALTELTAKVLEFYDAHGPVHSVCVDTIGLGAGVYDNLRLTKMRDHVHEFIASAAPLGFDMEEHELALKRFANLKACAIVFMSDQLRTYNMAIPRNAELTKQLGQWTMEYTGNGKLRIVDPPDSPDLADAAMMATWATRLGSASGGTWLPQMASQGLTLPSLDEVIGNVPVGSRGVSPFEMELRKAEYGKPESEAEARAKKKRDLMRQIQQGDTRRLGL